MGQEGRSVSLNMSTPTLYDEHDCVVLARTLKPVAPKTPQIVTEHASMAAHNEGQAGMPQGPCQCGVCISHRRAMERHREYPAGTRAVIVAIYGDREAYCVELFEGDKTIGVETAYPDDILPAPPKEAPSNAAV
jgi:hypothetical protein